MPFAVNPVQNTSQVAGTWHDWGTVEIQDVDEHRIIGVKELDLKLYELLFHFSRSSGWRSSSGLFLLYGLVIVRKAFGSL